MKVFLYLSVTLIFLIVLSTNVIGQKAMFQSCMNANDHNEIIHCEKEKIGQIIKNKIWPLYKDYQKNYSPSNLKLSFDINSRGVIANIKIIETPKSPVVSVSITSLHIQDSIIQGFVLLTDSNNSSDHNFCHVSYPLDQDGKADLNSINPEKIILRFPYRETFRIAEKMPRFPGCEALETEKEKEDCAKTNMLDYIYSNLEYPEAALKNGTEGQVVVTFIVERDGYISDINIVKEIGDGCGQAAVNLVETMNDMPERWIPGRQRGRPVRVLYTLPVKFKL